MIDRQGRRQFLAGMLAAGLTPKPTWADVGSPAFLSAAAISDGSYVLCGLNANLQVRFQVPLPARGHAAASHPIRPEAVAFAHRPGTFAVVIDCLTGAQKAILHAPKGRHFYGHGVFSADGGLLFTTENDFDAGQGRIGVWDARNGYQRVDEWRSGGIGPHDIKRLPNTDTLVVANGGIDTHPDTGRTKLNIATMAPNLSYIEDGKQLEVARLEPTLRKSSIRHLAVNHNGSVAFGMQWQGDIPAPALVGVHKRGVDIHLMRAGPNQTRAMRGYIGSVAFSKDGKTIAATSPRGGLLQIFETLNQELIASVPIADVSGVSMLNDTFVASSGGGILINLADNSNANVAQSNFAWDNHLVSLQM